MLLFMLKKGNTFTSKFFRGAKIVLKVNKNESHVNLAI